MGSKKRKKRAQPAPAEPPQIYEAELASGPSGVVFRVTAIDEATAMAHRQAGLDVVICGESLRANRKLARTIEAAVGPPTRPQEPHKLAGPSALPHFHQESRSTAGHTFYETDNPQRKARNKP
jgi:hypothetical protein